MTRKRNRLAKRVKKLIAQEIDGYPRISKDNLRQAAYVVRRRKGQSHDQAIASLLPDAADLRDAMDEAQAEHDQAWLTELTIKGFTLGRSLGWHQEFDWKAAAAGVKDANTRLTNQGLAFAWYVAMRQAGMGWQLAEMLALSRPPAIMTDDVFLAGLHRQFESNPALGDYYKSIAEGEGVNVDGAVYLPGLASYPGDPLAWVRGRGDIARVGELKNLTLEGAVNRTATRDEEPEPDIDVADDIVQQRMMDMIERDPSLTHADAEELYSEAKASLLPDAA